MDERNLAKVPEGTDHEDLALKTAARYFADELLPYFGIEGKVTAIAPTELVHLEVKKLFQDFNLVMEDGSWNHFEFQSKNEGLEGLKRFRVYEALTSYQHKVAVTTYVLFSGNIRHPMTSFTEGKNTYQIVPIIMKDRNADRVIQELQEKNERGEKITKQDLAPLTLCLLMSGEMPLKDRVKSAYKITRHATSVEPEVIKKVEAVLYIMADKFLDSMSMEEIVEGLSMTQLGQKLVNYGRKQAIAEFEAQAKEQNEQMKAEEKAKGKAEGRAEGIAEGRAEGIAEGRAEGIAEGRAEGIAEGRAEGIAEGREEGKAEGKMEQTLENAKSLIGLLDEQIIAERLHLPLETVQKLKKEKYSTL